MGAVGDLEEIPITSHWSTVLGTAVAGGCAMPISVDRDLLERATV
jgi:hypothetical protein